MSWVAIILFVLQHIPDVVDIIKRIIDLIHHLSAAEQLQAKTELGMAVQSGDHDAVRKVAAEWHAKCEAGSVGCSSDLVKE